MSTAVDAPFYSTEFGAFLSSKAARLAEILQDYNPYMSLVFIPPADRSEDDRQPYGILYSPPQLGPSIIRRFTENEIDDTAAILAWLFAGDLSKRDVKDVFAEQEAKRLAHELVEAKRKNDEALERQELVAALAVGGRDQKHFYRHNGKTFRS